MNLKANDFLVGFCSAIDPTGKFLEAHFARISRPMFTDSLQRVLESVKESNLEPRTIKPNLAPVGGRLDTPTPPTLDVPLDESDAATSERPADQPVGRGED